MDFDSSSKFISSLAKFLQSLCNGYVEFNSGVEVIGHIYLSVDTGKKIDYILNEKVCKTDENSVTFISNSFHAQPAEKPKPPTKIAQTSDPNRLPDTIAKAEEEDIIILEQPESKNVGTVPSRDSFHPLNANSDSKTGRPSKRSFIQRFSSNHRHSAKQGRFDPTAGPNGTQLETDSLHSESNSSSNFLPPQLISDAAITAATESDMSHLSKVFPQTFNDSANNQSAVEERDVKPQLDSDLKVIQVKQEYDQSLQGGEEDQAVFDDTQDQAFPGIPYDQYYTDGNKRGQRSDYGQMSGVVVQADFVQHGAGPSLEAVAGDSSGARLHPWVPGAKCPISTCQGNGFVCRFDFQRHWKEKHEEIIVKYICPHCSSQSKRRGDIVRHVRVVHQLNIPASALNEVYQHNKEFVDPWPLTLQAVLASPHTYTFT